MKMKLEIMSFMNGVLSMFYALVATTCRSIEDVSVFLMTAGLTLIVLSIFYEDLSYWLRGNQNCQDSQVASRSEGRAPLEGW